MNKLLFILLNFAIIHSAVAQTPESSTNKLPEIDIKKPDGNGFNTREIKNDGKPVIISFWATWCKPCVNELSAIADQYADWQKETGVKLIAVSIDDSRSIAKVAPFVNARNWEYEVYVDPNSDFKRAMNVNNVPHTFLLNGKGEVVWQHTSYTPGDEVKLYENIKKVLQGQPISE